MSHSETRLGLNPCCGLMARNAHFTNFPCYLGHSEPYSQVIDLGIHI